MRKRIVAFFLAFICIVSLLPTTLPVFAQSVYVALGDSITTGYGLQNPNEEAFASIIATEKNYTLCNLAVSGSTSSDLFNLISSGAADDSIKKAQVITITCGGNDIIGVLCSMSADAYNKSREEKIEPDEVLSILSSSSDPRQTALIIAIIPILTGGKNHTTISESEQLKDALSQFDTSFSAVISHIKNINPSCKIIVPTQYNPYGTFGGLLSVLNTQCDRSVRQLNKLILSKSEALGYEVVDVYSEFSESEESLCNGNLDDFNFDFHPNAAGHKKIAQIISDALSIKLPFSDVTEENWFYDAVTYVYENKLFSGVSDNSFAPNAPLTRAMFVTVLHRYSGSPDAIGDLRFTDVTKGAYYEEAILWATQNGIVSGYSETEFAPDDYITREQIASILLRLAVKNGTAPQGAWAIRLNYSDLDQVSDYAGDAVMYCTLKGLMNGKDGNRFAPKDNTTRAEAAVIMKKLAELKQ